MRLCFFLSIAEFPNTASTYISYIPMNIYIPLSLYIDASCFPLCRTRRHPLTAAVWPCLTGRAQPWPYRGYRELLPTDGVPSHPLFASIPRLPQTRRLDNKLSLHVRWVFPASSKASQGSPFLQRAGTGPLCVSQPAGFLAKDARQKGKKGHR